MLLCVMMVATLTSGCDGTADAVESADRPVADFSVVEADDRLSAFRDGQLIDVKAPAIEERYGIQAAAAGSRHVAVLTADSLMFVNREGHVTTTPMGDCSGIAGLSDGVAVLCDTTEQDQVVSVRRLTTDGKESNKASVHRLQERSHPTENMLSDDPGVQIVAAGATHFWLLYADSTGFARGGTRMLTKYRWDGTVTATLRLDGAAWSRSSDLSADGRHLAVFAGGSGGACHTRADLRVIDLVSMRLLDTSPDTPALAAAKGVRAGDLYFTGETLRWRHSTVIAEGYVANHGLGECDSSPEYWRRTFDTTTQTLTDTPLPVAPKQGLFIGPACSDIYNPDQSGVVPLQGHTVLYHPPMPDDCGVIVKSCGWVD